MNIRNFELIFMCFLALVCHRSPLLYLVVVLLFLHIYKVHRIPFLQLFNNSTAESKLIGLYCDHFHLYHYKLYDYPQV